MASKRAFFVFSNILRVLDLCKPRGDFIDSSAKKNKKQKREGVRQHGKICLDYKFCLRTGGFLFYFDFGYFIDTYEKRGDRI